MGREMIIDGFVRVNADEAMVIRGGIDKQAQEALYMVGYVIGVLAKVFVSFWTVVKAWFE